MKTIEEVKAAKRELELKISQMVNEFARTHGVRVDLWMDVVCNSGSADMYVLETEIKL